MSYFFVLSFFCFLFSFFFFLLKHRFIILHYMCIHTIYFIYRSSEIPTKKKLIVFYFSMPRLINYLPFVWHFTFNVYHRWKQNDSSPIHWHFYCTSNFSTFIDVHTYVHTYVHANESACEFVWIMKCYLSSLSIFYLWKTFLKYLPYENGMFSQRYFYLPIIMNFSIQYFHFAVMNW